MTQRPDVEAIMAGLKPFQLATVNHVFRRLWLDSDAENRFLVADEVGLGKTMVAKGVAARAMDYLWDAREQSNRAITIVYICSNRQIAQQNLAKLAQLTGGEVKASADRLTMLPLTMNAPDAERVQLVAFTPGTSLNFGTSAGIVRERVLLRKMLSAAFPGIDFTRHSWTTFLTGRAAVSTFHSVAAEDRFNVTLPAGIIEAFLHHLRTVPGPHGEPLVTELFAHHGLWNRTSRPSAAMRKHTARIISLLRNAMASASVGLLKPDLVILDEFQRFKELFSDRPRHTLSQAQQLAQQLINTGEAKTLVLSATPYKMYTLPDEPSGENHYEDFTDTISFLVGRKKAEEITRSLAVMRQGIISGTAKDVARAKQARTEVENALTKVMSRTERLAATEDRSGMLAHKPLDHFGFDTTDVYGWRALDDLSQDLNVPGAFEYWRSAPYTVNFMDRRYQLQERLQAAVAAEDPSIAATVSKHQHALLQWSSIDQYQKIDSANAKLRALIGDIVGSGAWRLAWISPSLPYVEPGGVYASQAAQDFTKRLIFSAWKVVPRTVAALVSYEIERQAVNQAAISEDDKQRYQDRISPPLRFAWSKAQASTLDHDQGLPLNLPNLTVLYPSVALAHLGDPLPVAKEMGTELPLDRGQYFEYVKARVTDALEHAGIRPQAGAEGLRRRWYGVAPFLLDRAAAFEGGWDPLVPDEAWSKGDTETRLVDHVQWARQPNLELMGDPPEDLAEVLTLMAAAGPGVCALRAITRSADTTAQTEPDIRAAALDAATGLRNLFNRPTIVSLIRGAATTTGEVDSYWHQVLMYCFDGNLQATLDEYCHMLTGSSERDASDRERAERLGAQIHETTPIRTARNVFQDIQAHDDRLELSEHSINSHCAALFGRSQSSDTADHRESSVRESFNSPFWPFVLASTSVGQEGLDFHTYSHAVVHWNLPSNPVDLEQREGRVHRYKGHAVRKNVAAQYGNCALSGKARDPWDRLFDAAEADRPPGDPLLDPYWVKTGPAQIERYVPAMPLSTESRRYAALLRTVGAYRFVLGQPRQDELIGFLGEHAQDLRIDLSPPVPATAQGQNGFSHISIAETTDASRPPRSGR